MSQALHNLKAISPACWLFAAGLLILATQPVLWLVATWTDPSYDSPGAWVFACALGLFLWSVTSRNRDECPPKKPLAICLLLATALLRLAGQLLAINLVGALALVVDVYALGLMFNLHRRERAVSSGWLAVVFVFALPVTNLLQRTLGYVLQQASAVGAAFLLGIFYRVEREGIRILLDGHNILVDLPCSGTQAATFMLLFFAVLMALKRPGRLEAGLGVLHALLLAYLANTVRITILCVGVAFPNVLGGIDVMAQPWHDLIGLGCLLLLGFIPLMRRAASMPSASTHPKADEAPAVSAIRLPSIPESWRRQARMLLGSAFVAATLIIVTLPHQPLDTSRSLGPLFLPAYIQSFPGRAVPLQPREAAYFTRFGGRAAKMQYGPHALMVVQTTAPLRHLHAPSDCLRGAGFQVNYRGQEQAVIPSAVYEAIAPDGARWRIAVTFVSSDGQYATSVSEAVWYWMQKPGGTWSTVQRITPQALPMGEAHAWDRSVAAALDLPVGNRLSAQNDSGLQSNQS